MDFEIGSADITHEETLGGGDSGNIVLGDKDTYRSFIINYTLVRGAIFEEGILRILNDATNVQILRDEQDTGDAEVTFTVNISGDNVRLGWSLPAGVDVTMNYIIHRVKN